MVVQEITDTHVRHLGREPEYTHIVIQEIRDEDWGFAGNLADHWHEVGKVK